MKTFFKIMVIVFVSVQYSYAQDTTITIYPGNFNLSNEILLATMDGWYFKQGNDTTWNSKDMDITGWKKIKPVDLSAKMADKNGRLEGWFRIKIKPDSSFENTSLSLRYYGWAAVAIYIDGKLLSAYGKSGTDENTFREFNPSNKPPIAFPVKSGNSYSIAIHFTDYVSPFSSHKIKSEESGLHLLFRINGPVYQKKFADFLNTFPTYTVVWFTVAIVLVLLFWLLALLNKKESNLKLFAIAESINFLWLFAFIGRESNMTSFIANRWFLIGLSIMTLGLTIQNITILSKIFNKKLSIVWKVLIGLDIFFVLINCYFNNDIFTLIAYALPLLIYVNFIYTSWKTAQGSQWAIIAGIIGQIIAGLLSFTLTVIYKATFIPFAIPLLTATTFSFPLATLVYVAIRFKEIIKEVQQNAAEVFKLSEEKREHALRQQKILEEEVARQTNDLRTMLDNLKATQAQLVQSEKMASLGELTAGIAHEIQNPLNFVNNFSDVNKELLTEMNDEIEKGNYNEAKNIAKDVTENEEKINHHGKRADAIVKGMLQHSRSSSGQKEPTNINALADEYLRLAYHGLRAKDKSFNATLKTDFDGTIGNINIIPQDIGRVILNLITNAFYVVAEKKKLNIDKYEPTVSVSTKKVNGKVEIKVADNGNGIPPKVLDKIFQPFFTTKPTGQGTGLGLSLAYDIVKAHGGELKVETRDSEGSTFIIVLPI